jgi:hypothetical protein
MSDKRIVRNKRCTWAEDGCGAWKTGCGNYFCFDDGGPTDNGQRFCGYCGGALTELRAPEPVVCGMDGDKEDA